MTAIFDFVDVFFTNYYSLSVATPIHVEARSTQSHRSIALSRYHVYFFSLASFPTFLRSALREQWLNFFICFSNSRGGYPSTQGTIGIWKNAGLLKYLYNTVRSRAKSMGYVIMCTRDQEIDPFANLFFANCIQIHEIRKI